MAKVQWIRIGQGSKKQELEHVIAVLKKRWQQRYEFRIDENKTLQDDCFELLIKHN